MENYSDSSYNAQQVIRSTLQSVRSNEAFDASLNLVSYMQTDYTYDTDGSNSATPGSHGWLTSIKNTWNAKNAQGNWVQTTLTQNQYSYDNAGQRLTNKITSADGTNRTELYGYDEQNRLKTVDYGDGQRQSYAFDAMGNRLSKTDSVSGSESYTFNAANMLLSRAGASYTNDADGNTLTGGGRSMSWDAQNRMVSCTKGVVTSSFTYGADGLRRQMTANGTTTDYVLDNSMFVRERNHATGANIATYLVGARGPEYRRDDVAGTVRWYLYDGLGSVLGEVDPNGSVTSSRKYDVYGAVRGGVNPGGSSRHKFVGSLGHPSDDETGLIYMRARYYDPAVGRFVSEDPALSGHNWFIYANDEPSNVVDTSGHAFLTPDQVAYVMALMGWTGAFLREELLRTPLNRILWRMWEELRLANDVAQAQAQTAAELTELDDAIDPTQENEWDSIKQAAFQNSVGAAAKINLISQCWQAIMFLAMIEYGSDMSGPGYPFMQ